MMSTATATTPAADTFDQAKAEAFAGRFTEALSQAAMVLMSSIGHRSGLFDTLAEMSRATCHDLAARTGLAERYIREWLAVMATAGVVEYDPEEATYHLPAEHAACLTRAATPGNLAVTAQFIGVSATVEDDILARFRDGRGLHYHQYRRFHEVMAEDSAQTVVAALFDHILPLVPGLAARLEEGIDVADVGCGAGQALLQLAARFPMSRYTGFDLCPEAFAPSVEAARRRGLANLTFTPRDLSRASSLGALDLILAFDAVHDQKDPQGLLDLVRRSLKPSGVFLMQDIGGSSHLEKNMGNPLAPFLYTASCMHCVPVSLSQGGAGLGTMWGVEMASEMLTRAGFSTVEVKQLPHDPINVYFVARP